MKQPDPPKPLKPLARMLARHGFTLAVPFDNVRAPGYIATYNRRGQEVIVDDGRCLQEIAKTKRRYVALGDSSKRSRFDLGAFLKFFGRLFGLDLRAQKARSVSIRFPKRFVSTRYITILDIEEDWERLKPACRKALADPENFLIVQALETDAIEYEVRLGRTVSAGTRESIEQAVQQEAELGGFEVRVAFGSRSLYRVNVKGKKMTVGYKRYRIGVPLDAPESRVQRG